MKRTVEGLTIREQRDTTIMSTITRQTVLSELPHLYHEARIRYWNNGTARSYLGMI
jgi:hypothetical protein